MARRPPFSRDALEEAVAASITRADALRQLGLRAAGHNFRTINKYIQLWGIDTSHFDANLARKRANHGRAKPLSEILVAGSTHHRGHLKKRLYAEGLKERRCELCGQGEIWHGREMSLILDHINGRAGDNRLENLQIVCANCAATLDTHCGRNLPRKGSCARCGHTFRPQSQEQRYCSRKCGGGGDRRDELRGVPRPEARKVERPPYELLMREIAETSYLAVGRKYGVSDNAVRKWVRWYEQGLEEAA